MSNWFDILYGGAPAGGAPASPASPQVPEVRTPEAVPTPEATRTPEVARAPEPTRAPEPVRAPEVARIPPAAIPPERPPVSSVQPPRSTMRLTKDQLKSAPSLPRMPSRWSLELQKAAFHLSHSEFPNGGCRAVCFSGLQRGGGTSTISYLVAHYLAAEVAGMRVLFLDFSMDGRSAATSGADGVLRVGETVPVDFLRTNSNAFARYSIRPGNEDSPTNSSRWLRELMDIARRHCDWIIVDTPPFFSSPESYPVAQLCDGTVLVMKSGETRYPALNGLVADLEQMGIRPLGTVMNFRRYPVPRWLLKYI